MKKAISALLLAAVMLALPLSLISCDSSEVHNRVFYEYFDTVTVVYDYTGGSLEDFDAVAEDIEDALREYHRLYDIYNEYDGFANLATVNRLAGDGPVKVDSKIIDMLLYAKEAYRLTGGAVNVAMGSVLSLWHEAREGGVSLPDSESLRLAAEHVSIDSLVINVTESTVEITDPEASLDVGAIAKGYATEKIAELLIARGISGYALDVGGNLRVVGTKPDGSGWTSGIKNPDLAASDPYVRVLTVSDSALVTSGVYERFFTVDGVKYHHIIDPETLMPGTRYLSVSVHAPSSALADALSTALFNMDYGEAEKLVSTLDGVEATFVFSDGTVTICD